MNLGVNLDSRCEINMFSACKRGNVALSDKVLACDPTHEQWAFRLGKANNSREQIATIHIYCSGSIYYYLTLNVLNASV